MRKLVYGVGVNDADYVVNVRVNGKQVMCPYYLVWRNMLKRAYCEETHKDFSAYQDVTVCEEWLSFTTFREWMEGEDWEGNELDKDIIVPGNREYRADRCLFVSRAVNGLLNNHANARGAYPCGVSEEHGGGKYRARIRMYSKEKYLGHFDTVNEAEQVYKKAKKRYIEEVAEAQTDARIRDGLRRHADLLAA